MGDYRLTWTSAVAAGGLLLPPLRFHPIHTATDAQIQTREYAKNLKSLHSAQRLAHRKMTYINNKPTYYQSSSVRTEASQPPPEPEYPMRGLGDLVEKVTVNTGIKRIVDKIAKATGKDCGCNKRKDALNRLVPFKKEDGNG